MTTGQSWVHYCCCMYSLQVGDVALFMTDAHGNYLALSVDGKTYYLNHSCVSSFSEYLSSKGKRGWRGESLAYTCHALLFPSHGSSASQLEEVHWLMSFLVVQNTLYHTHTHTHTQHTGSCCLVESQRERLWKLER